MSGALMMMRALTALHPGAGTSVGAIDLPVQREVATNWPMIQSSSIKGVLRDTARWQVNGEDLAAADATDEIKAVFGPPPGEHGEDATGGALIITDARIFAFPVRSLQGIFGLITCKEALRRLAVDCVLAGSDPPVNPDDLPDGSCESADTLFFSEGEQVKMALLEDLRVEYDDTGASAAGSLTAWGALASVSAPARGRLVVVSDEVFNYCVQYRTQIMTRNALDLETKTVEPGALFSQELLPPETLMYSVLLAEQRSNGNPISKVAGWLEASKSVIQIGADSSTGKGICKVAISGGGNDAEDEGSAPGE